jgi:O-antigen/teichoic acid export membrane protein
MSMKEIKGSFFDYSSLVGSNIGIILLSFVTVPLIVRALGAAGYGRLNLFFMVCQAVLVFTTRWTSTATIRFGKEEFIKKGAVNGTFWARTMISLPLFSLAAAALLIFRERVTGYIGIDRTYGIWLVLAYIVLFHLLDCGHTIAKATARMKVYAVMELLERVILIGLLVIALSLPVSIGLVLIILFHIMRQMIVMLYFLYRNKTRIFVPVSIDRNRIIEIVRYAAPLVFVSVSAMAMGWIDVFVIKIFSDAESVGLYSLSYKLMNYMKMLSTHAATVILPILVSLHVAKKDATIRRYVDRFIPQIAFLWSVVLSLAMVLMPLGFTLLFGEGFRASLDVLLILLVGLSSYVLFSLHRPILHVYKLTKKALLITVVALSFNVLLDFILVPRYGINGAAVATVCSLFAMTVMQTRVTGSYLKMTHLKQFAPLSIAGVAFIAALAVKRSSFLCVIAAFTVLCYSWILSKRLKIFSSDDARFLDRIEMPARIRRMLKNVIGALA